MRSGGGNWIDPMQLRASDRDLYPKRGLGGGYLGDGLPRCADLPADAFLRSGAQYSYMGTQPPDDYLELNRSASALYGTLCAAAVVDGGTRCTFPSLLTLSAALACTGAECAVEH
eukprot:4310860-Prymnesium_polylepis.1